ncbi:H-NS histone family protein [Paracoccus sp. PS-1]|uniref:H-NS histone family protein n=1 Tax=unclassified Paracoccus (in: a-proteobacteria) TaxID=2688777 RepID=UPI00048B9087|nr:MULTISPECIES: H-NS histone family protein [unclassified Paracoccus (in: a-proteobacteria)]MDQ7260850.1 H-NS histone family protein [Paracoccus sp. PS1]RQP04333.1 MAG: H-NS histone family protein [Paracoccus sp. BP8]UFM63950.1 H-NS histone family protein [Paracoccus sp. MA]
MTNPDLNALSLAELKQLRKDVEKAIEGFEARRKAEARAKAEEAAKQFGFSLADLVAAAASRPAAVPKYAHPENPELTWSGRGRKPGWIAEALAAGKTLEDFAI